MTIADPIALLKAHGVEIVSDEPLYDPCGCEAARRVVIMTDPDRICYRDRLMTWDELQAWIESDK